MFVNIILKLDTLNICMYIKNFFIVICRLFKMLIRQASDQFDPDFNIFTLHCNSYLECL